jgi:hypothetical protein
MYRPLPPSASLWPQKRSHKSHHSTQRQPHSPSKWRQINLLTRNQGVTLMPRISD